MTYEHPSDQKSPGSSPGGATDRIGRPVAGMERLAGHLTRSRAFFMTALIASVGLPLRFNSMDRNAVPLNA